MTTTIDLYYDDDGTLECLPFIKLRDFFYYYLPEFGNAIEHVEVFVCEYLSLVELQRLARIIMQKSCLPDNRVIIHVGAVGKVEVTR